MTRLGFVFLGGSQVLHKIHGRNHEAAGLVCPDAPPNVTGISPSRLRSFARWSSPWMRT